MTGSILSVVIAAYNRGPRIAPTLDSVLAQTTPPAEVVVVDDCSPDATGDWVRTHYPAVRVTRTERNGGTSAARNHGARAATGNVLVFLDHDDVLHPHAIETLTGLLRTFPQARAAFADHTYVNTVTGVKYPDHHGSQPAFERLRQIRVAEQTAAGRLYRRPLFRALAWGNLLQQPWAIYRDDFLRLGGFAEDIRYCEDWETYLRVTRAVPVALTDTVISDHLVEGENLHLSPHQAEMHRRVLRRLLWLEVLNPRVVYPVVRKLAMYAKADGDRLAATELARAWRMYLRAFALWPFDHVVAARALVLWPLRLLVGRSRPEAAP